ncbi:MAG: pseudouridine synthase [Pseudomonadota bacterium]
MRLQKFLSHAGQCSRRQGEQWILEGRVAVNGVVVRELGSRVDPAADRVVLDGRPVGIADTRIYIALNKPPGYVTSCSQPGEKLVTDLVGLRTRLFPVGRLDKASTGLLLLTDDGRIHHGLSHPSFDHEKEYDVCVAAPISDEALAQMASGLTIQGRRTRPATVRRVSDRRFRIVLLEGRNRQIRRMVGTVGHRVKTLHRVRVAHIGLGALPQGQWRHLSEQEVDRLLKMISEK